MKTRAIWLMPLLWGLMTFTCVTVGNDPERRTHLSGTEKDVRDGVTVTLLILILMVGAHEAFAWKKP